MQVIQILTTADVNAIRFIPFDLRSPLLLALQLQRNYERSCVSHSVGGLACQTAVASNWGSHCNIGRAKVFMSANIATVG